MSRKKRDRAKQSATFIAKLKDVLINIAPLLGLILVIAVFAILTDGKTVSEMNIKILSGQIIVTALVAIGAVFSFSCGALDMSTGGSMCLAAIAGGLVGNKTGSFAVMIVVTFVVSMVIAVFKGVVAAYLTLPVFIVTIIFGSVLSAIGMVLLGDNTIVSLGKIVKITDMTAINVIFLVGFYVFALILFNYTKIGKACKLQGGNPLAAGQSGISAKKNTIIAFMVSGFAVTLAAIIEMLRTKTVTAATGGTVGNDVMVAIVLGGMPLTGGPRSKISAGLIGAATITILNNGLSVYGVSNDMIQIIRGVVFLVVVFITSMSYRTKYLPR